MSADRETVCQGNLSSLRLKIQHTPHYVEVKHQSSSVHAVIRFTLYKWNFSISEAKSIKPKELGLYQTNPGGGLILRTRDKHGEAEGQTS